MSQTEVKSLGSVTTRITSSNPSQPYFQVFILFDVIFYCQIDKDAAMIKKVSLINGIFFINTIATGFGDPHMVTLDGTPFTFNGYGEYFILKVRGVNFTLQGRMEPLIDDDGTKTDATVYTAFAGKESGSDTVQVRD